MNLSFEAQIAIAAGFVAFLVFGLVARYAYKKIPRRLNTQKFQAKWSDLQKLCKHPDTWPEAVQRADKLLDDALRKRRFKGKKMGERIVSAQRRFSDNDAVWYAHNLTKKLSEQPEKVLKEPEVKQALVGFRQALRDLGALENDTKK